MDRLTIKQYAIKHKLSIYQVIKLVKSGKLETESVKEDERETLYILCDTNSARTESAPTLSVKPKQSLEERVDALESEVAHLREKLETLLKEKCFNESCN